MSRIGKNPIKVADNVKINLSAGAIAVEGPKGKLGLDLRPEVEVKYDDNKIFVSRKNESKIAKSMHGLFRMLIYNMVVGVDKGFKKELEVIGTGYRASVEGKKLVVNAGYSNPVNFDIPEGITIKVDNNTKILIEGISKQAVGQIASEIRKIRPPEPYKGKGIKYTDEIIRRKAGKSTK